MAYITREDGERFVIPSYRDTLSTKKSNLLKREIMMLSSNYGEYITLQKKGDFQYEVAFSPDSGYLLGESVWHYFKTPVDMIYCEGIPNTTEAILVVVKAGNVYLDGRFPIEAIVEELIIFKTQQNNFEVYIHGDVPLSEAPEPDKFSFDTSSVKSFTILTDPVFPQVPTIKSLQLQLVTTVLTAQGIGVFPTRKVVGIMVTLGLLWMGWSYINTEEKPLPMTTFSNNVNPYQEYQKELTSPDPAKELHLVANKIRFLYSMPGWYPAAVEYLPGTTSLLRASVESGGAKAQVLLDWADKNNVQVEVAQDGIYVNISSTLQNRSPPKTILPFQDVIALLVDRLSYVQPGNSLKLGVFMDKKVYKETTLTISLSNISPLTLDLVAELLENLPLVLFKVSLKVNNGNLSGQIILQVLGN
jgi:hypothetical protein